MKAKKEYKVRPKLPPELEPLRRLAFNLAFSWHSDVRDLFMRMDPRLWTESGHNPVLLLGLINQDRLDILSQDLRFLGQLEEVTQGLELYLNQPRPPAGESPHSDRFLAAYFSAEFGLASCLPIYSGGLGILAGDHLKSASDLNVPLVAVGLLYQEGYFSQYLSTDGWQMETYPINDFDNMPVKMVRDRSDKPITTSVLFKGEEVIIYIWRADVGRIPLYLLDTNVPENKPELRDTTDQLYGGDREMRLKQEIVLGIGGVRALKAVGLEPTVIHMNEGHASFSALERINQLRKDKGLTFDAAREVVQSTTVFTTHTPVPAGNDTFDPELVRAYFEEYCKELGVNYKVILGYGRVNPRDDIEPFGMTPLALRLSAYVNGVSRPPRRGLPQHVEGTSGLTSRSKNVPIGHVTNGIHVPTWISREFSRLFDRYLGVNWSEDPNHERVWENVDQIPTSELWRAHIRCREQLVAYTRRRLSAQLDSRGAPASEVHSALEVLNPDTLTIGFARRFATYKRATLLFRDPDRLDRLVNNPDKPVQIILAGKAHPQDNEGKQFIKEIIHLARQERFRHRIVFLEDYNIHTAHMLVAGSDVLAQQSPAAPRGLWNQRHESPGQRLPEPQHSGRLVG